VPEEIKMAKSVWQFKNCAKFSCAASEGGPEEMAKNEIY
jgi:hypothetical protein